MRKIIEYTLVPVDGVFAGPRTSEFMTYRDAAYIRERIGADRGQTIGAVKQLDAER